MDSVIEVCWHWALIYSKHFHCHCLKLHQNFFLGFIHSVMLSVNWRHLFESFSNLTGLMCRLTEALQLKQTILFRTYSHGLIWNFRVRNNLQTEILSQPGGPLLYPLLYRYLYVFSMTLHPTVRLADTLMSANNNSIPEFLLYLLLGHGSSRSYSSLVNKTHGFNLRVSVTNPSSI